MKKQIIISVSILVCLILGTIAVILYGKGYRFGLTNEGKPNLSSTGLLVVTSNPNGAQVFIDGILQTATDNTISLFPGNYSVRIFKEGYFPWQKQIKVEKELVSKAEALLFATAPKLENITASGIENPVIDPSMTKIAYKIASGSAKKNGIYLLDMNAKLILTLQSASTQLIDDSLDNFSNAAISFSPDGKELLATISGTLKEETTYLLDTSGFNEKPQDVTLSLSTVENSWLKDKEEKEKSRYNSLRQTLQKVFSQNFEVLSWSPDENKILYEASASATLPIIINPRLPDSNLIDEQRAIKKESIYVYDLKEDKNFKVLNSLSVTCKPERTQIKYCYLPLNWLSDSKHLLYTHDKKIEIMDYDGTNSATVYAGPFMNNYVFPWTNVSKVLILTNLNNPSIAPNLYTIELK
ncbi:MAG: PEGA domain-containing protein [Patescibacteria group bacterium]